MPPLGRIVVHCTGRFSVVFLALPASTVFAKEVHLLPLKLLIAGLVASALGLAMFALTVSGFNTDVNVLDLALHNSTSALTNAATLPVNASTDLEMDDDVTGTMTGTITSTLTVTGTDKIINAITQYFSGTLSNTVTISNIVALRDDGWGFGEIFKLYALAEESGETPDQIEMMRNSGMGWGEIARALDLSPGNKGNNLGAAVSGRGLPAVQQPENNPSMTSQPNGTHGNPHGGPPGKSKNKGK
jgi:hypothetical protein